MRARFVVRQRLKGTRWPSRHNREGEKEAAVASQVDLARGLMRTGKIEIGPDQRRASQCGEDAVLANCFFVV
jgi:hypothetical protein